VVSLCHKETFGSKIVEGVVVGGNEVFLCRHSAHCGISRCSVSALGLWLLHNDCTWQILFGPLTISSSELWQECKFSVLSCDPSRFKILKYLPRIAKREVSHDKTENWHSCHISDDEIVRRPKYILSHAIKEEPQAQHAGLTSYKDFQWRKTDVEMVSKSVPALVLTGCIGIKFILPNLHSQRFCSNALITQLSWCASKNANIKKISPDVHVMSSTTKQCWTDVKKWIYRAAFLIIAEFHVVVWQYHSFTANSDLEYLVHQRLDLLSCLCTSKTRLGTVMARTSRRAVTSRVVYRWPTISTR
jgi:hypothetical protein